ncbi:MAG TPA: hypothetical protein VHD62_11460 [Opitutaceae bacterium]|nr:hypothetical protein [Opitutaceae bacterium]
MTWSHIARALDPSIPVAGNHAGASSGNIHIVVPRRKNPNALAVFMTAGIQRCACHAVPRGGQLSPGAAHRNLPLVAGARGVRHFARSPGRAP